ncbi:hypothetical protein C8R46DRAFT_1098834 [Mycena filopes]|nr:hypothetical protein C8R46DRAFT_1098834 [Mycena filopes]
MNTIYRKVFSKPASPRLVATPEPLEQPLLPSTERDADALDADMHIIVLGTFGRLLLDGTVLSLGLVHAAVITMCAHALLVIASPDRYSPTLPWSPAIGAVGVLLSLSITLFIKAGLSFVAPPSTTDPEKDDDAPALQTDRPYWSMCVHYPFGTLLGVFVLSLSGFNPALLYAEAFNIGVTAGVMHLVLHLAQFGTEAEGLWLVMEPMKGAAIALCGHAAFVIAAAHLADYATTLPDAPWIGFYGALIGVPVAYTYRYCVGQDPDNREVLEIDYVDCAHVLYDVASNTFFGACNGLVWFGVIGGLISMSSEGLDILPAMGVGLVGGTLMGLCGIRFVFE